MKNPFVFGIEVSGKQFTDRSDELNEIKSDLLRAEHHNLFPPQVWQNIPCEEGSGRTQK